ncbi:hypothetical protein ACFL4G_13145, partial [Thermodesulfobacteriota bacterium]
YLEDTILSHADLAFADVSRSHMKPMNVDGVNISGIKGLDSLRDYSPHSIASLRKVSKEFGYRKEERILTGILFKERLPSPFNPDNRLPISIRINPKRLYRVLRIHLSSPEKIFEYLFLALPTDYGANPWRSLKCLAMTILIFTLFYAVALRKRRGEDGIWKIWIPDRTRKDLGEKIPVRLRLRFFTALRYGLYFSILSAFSIGWRDLNVGHWIARIQPREYTLRATGWVRTVSGIQSLLSIYFMVLWALTYFGRPFA